MWMIIVYLCLCVCNIWIKYLDNYILKHYTQVLFLTAGLTIIYNFELFLFFSDGQQGLFCL